MRWFSKWKNYVGYEKAGYYANIEESCGKPGPIDNTDILETVHGQQVIRKTCFEQYDYFIISVEQWNALHLWYGGGRALPRKVIISDLHPRIEIRPLLLKVLKSSDMNQHVWVFASCVSTVGQFKSAMCENFGLKEEDVKVWDFYPMRKYKVLEDMNERLNAAQILSEQEILLEEMDTKGNFAPVIATSAGNTVNDE